MKFQLLRFLRQFLANDRKLLLLVGTLLIALLAYLKARQVANRNKKREKLNLTVGKVRKIMKELEIEANFVLNFAHLKYKDKPLLIMENKQLQLKSQFI